MSHENKTYLGDSVYAEFENGGVVLTTENGMGASNTIFMEREVLVALEDFWERMTGPPPHADLEAVRHIDYQIKTLNAAKVGAAILADKLNGFDGRKDFSIAGTSLDFDARPHAEIVAIMQHLKAGKWEKSIGYDGKTIDYKNYSVIPGFTVRFWQGEPPPSCKIVEEEIDVPEVPAVPAGKKKVLKLVCKETVTAETISESEQ